jgi:hypothetical protein
MKTFYHKDTVPHINFSNEQILIKQKSIKYKTFYFISLLCFVTFVYLKSDLNFNLFLFLIRKLRNFKRWIVCLPDRRPAESKVLIVSLPSTAITLVEREWASNTSLYRFAQKEKLFLIKFFPIIIIFLIFILHGTFLNYDHFGLFQ